MASLEEMWARFSLTEEEEGGAEVPKEEEEIVHRLAGRFYTKRVLNVEAVARTFKPLWRTAGELKIRDIGEHILLFEFEDVLDLERVLEFEPWSYDKHLVAFERVFDIESVPFLEFSHATFWVQMHNIPERSLKTEVGEMIGKKIGRVIQAAEPEDDGAGSEFLRVRINIDISKPLLRCSKLRSEGKQVGWVGLKYERLPNFCYWCGRVTHGERDCEVWLRGKGSLRKEEQQYGEWLRAESLRATRKTVVVVFGSSCSQAPWRRKGDSNKGPSSNHPSNRSNKENSGSSKEAYSSTRPAANIAMDYVEISKPNDDNGDNDITVEGYGIQHQGQLQGLYVKKQSNKLEEVVVGLTLKDNADGCMGETNEKCLKKSVGLGTNARMVEVMPMQECTNQVTNSTSVESTRKWKKLAREMLEYDWYREMIKHKNELQTRREAIH
ncbi:hypothetical protein SO802_007505 [Lithocarpus litseifolius]|uniref:CCHC-type domain-containing protein n=1 Tax=Lithocarpus litseifolius TaxID=425828 RepID=A0AAW2DNT1_9ROSI